MKKSPEILGLNISGLCKNEKVLEQIKENRRKMFDTLHELELARFQNNEIRAFWDKQESTTSTQAVAKQSIQPVSTNKPVLISEEEFYQIIGRGEASAAANGMWFKRRRDLMSEPGNESLLPPYKQIGRKRFYPEDTLIEWLRTADNFE